MKPGGILATALALFVSCASPPETALAQAQSTQVSSLDQLLAPVALYPDQLLAQILQAAAMPDKLVELDAWIKVNQNLKGTKLQDAAVKAGYDPSLVALALFPQVVTRMAQQRDWTTLLGETFAADRDAVFAAIQRLRHQAEDVGTLKDSAQQEVSTRTTSSGQEVIVIEPSNPQVVYVPQYNPQVVYTQAPTTVVTQTVIVEDDNTDEMVAAGLIGFTAGIAIGAAMDNNYYYGPHGWYGGAYMYNDAWDDYADAREDAREDWTDHREDLSEERTDRRENTQEQRTDRQENRTENRPETAQARQDQRASGQTATGQQRQTERASGTAPTTATTQSAGRTGSAEARGKSGTTQRAAPRSGTDAFSGYSSGGSQRASSARGQSSRGSARGGGSRGGGGRRR